MDNYVAEPEICFSSIHAFLHVKPVSFIIHNTCPATIQRFMLVVANVPFNLACSLK